MYRNFITDRGFLTPAECDSLTKDAENLLPVQDAGFGKDNTTDSRVRTSKIRWIKRLENIDNFGWIFDKIDNYIRLQNAMYFDIDYNETGCAALQHTTYLGEDQGHYDYHMDHFMPGNWPDARKLTFVIQLSDPKNYEGGAFSLRDCPIPIPDYFTEQGSILVFPSILYHAVFPVTEGVRRSIVGWYRGPTWR